MIDKKLVHGSLSRVWNKRVVSTTEFQFNPTEVVTDLGTQWYTPQYPGAFLSPVQFTQFTPRTISFTLFLYGRGSNGVDAALGDLEQFLAPSERFSVDTTRFVSPGVAKLVLGKTVTDVVVTSATITKKMWDKSLNTTVAEVAIKLQVISTGPSSEMAYLARIGRKKIDGYKGR